MDNLEENKEAGTPNPQLDDELTPEKAKRYKEQIAGSKAEAERLRTLAKEIAKAATDSKSLIELYNKDPKMANEVAQEFGYTDFEDAKRVIAPESKEQKYFTEEDFEREYQKRKQKETHQSALKKAEKVIAKLPEKEKEKATAYFTKITDGKTLDEETALEFAEMATLYVTKDKIKTEKTSEGLAMYSSTGLTDSKPKQEGPQYVVRDGNLVLLSNE